MRMSMTWARIMDLFGLIILMSVPYGSGVSAQTLLTDRAQVAMVAKSWLSLIIEQNGSWGATKSAEFESIQDFMFGDRMLGYFCRVHPKGFMVISLYKELPPVTAYSTTSAMDPDAENVMTKLLKEHMANAQDVIRLTVEGSIKTASDNISMMAYRQMWDELENNTVSTEARDFAQSETNYRQGDILLSTAWNQWYPYNAHCPACEGVPPDDHACAGCVAIAGAQIMRYWSWPPYRLDEDQKNCPYNWNRMFDWCTGEESGNDRRDEQGALLTQTQIEAVARLCYEAGVAAGSIYGADKSQAWIGDMPGKDMLDALRDEFFYDPGAQYERHYVYPLLDWFKLIKREINANRPILYAIQNTAIGSHSMVIDGWQKIGAEPIRMYHINYGWGPGDFNAWYAIDAVLYSKCWENETMVRQIKPAVSLGSVLSGGLCERSIFIPVF